MSSSRIVSGILATSFAISVALFSGTAAHATASFSSLITTPDQELYSAYSTEVSPDGNIQAIPAYDTDRVIFAYADTLTYVVVTDPNGDINSPRSLAFSPDGSTVYVANYGTNHVAIIDVATHAVTGTFTADDDRMTTIGVSPDGTRIVIPDDWGAVSVYDATNNYASLGRDNMVSGNYVEVFFLDNNEALVANQTANFFYINLADATVGNEFDNNNAGGYGVCASADLSALYWVTESRITVVDPTDGTTIDEVAIPGAQSLSLCTITNMNKLLITDYVTDPGQLFVVDLATLTLDQKLSLPGQDYPNGVNVMNECIALVEGYYTNFSVVTLSDDICSRPAPALPNTGVDGRAYGLAAALVVASGFVALVMARVRRRHVN